MIGTFYVCSGPHTCKNSKVKPRLAREELPEGLKNEWRRVRYQAATITIDEIYVVPEGGQVQESVVADSPFTILFKYPSDTYSWEEFTRGKPSMIPTTSGPYLLHPARYYSSLYDSILVNHPQQKVVFFKK